MGLEFNSGVMFEGLGLGRQGIVLVLQSRILAVEVVNLLSELLNFLIFSFK